MKPILILFSIVFGSISTVAAQQYNKLIEPDKSWQVITWDVTQVCYVDHGDEYFFSGDTVLNGKTYSKLFLFPINPTGGSTFCPPIAVDNSNAYLASIYMREDTVSKKVYVADNFSSEWLLFDFSLNQGDTIFGAATSTCFQSYLIIDSISPITFLNGFTTKIFYLNNGANYIEGIGGTFGLFKGFCLPNDDAILCVKSSNIPIYSQGLFSFFGCAGTVDINEITTTQYSIINDNYILKFQNLPLKSDTYTFAIVDNLGKKVVSGTIETNGAINIEYLKNGIYFVTVYMENSEICSKKFLVNK